MAPVIDDATVAPLTRKTRGGGVLQRPVRIQAEVAMALTLSPGEVLARAAADPATGKAASKEAASKSMSEECMVHLIRRDLRARAGGRALAGRLAEDLTPLLLERCDRGLKWSIRGFPPSAADEIREEVLGRLAVSLAGPGDEADFLEVRFALALKRLRIDACRRERRRLHGLVALEDVSAGSAPDDPEPAAVDRAPPSPPSQEDRLLIRQALATLTDEERKVLVLHKLAGVPLSSSKSARAPDRKQAGEGPKPKQSGETPSRTEIGAATAGGTLVGLLGRSERTLRNRLRSAEAKLAGLREETSREDET